MTNKVSRRGAVKLAAALAVGTGMQSANPAFGQHSTEPADARTDAGANKTADDFLARAKQSPESFMLSEPEIFSLDTDKHSRTLVVTSARDEKGNQTNVYVRSRSVRIFRADPTVDEFTSQGGVYWRFRGKPGKVKLKMTADSDLFNQSPRFGPLVMLVRDNETVRLYTMTPDLRC